MRQTLERSAGPGPRQWNRLTEAEVGRPHFRAKKNPITASGQTVNYFPVDAVAANGEALELVAWALRDTVMALVSKQLTTPLKLFVSGSGAAYTPFGGTTAFNKPELYANVASQTGLLPNPQSFLVSHMRQIIRGDIFVGDLMLLAYNTLYSLQCGDMSRIYFEEPGAILPSAQSGLFIQQLGSLNPFTGSVSSIGWPTAHNVASLQTGLKDPSLNGAPDMGVVINQGRQFVFIIDPTQGYFNGSVFTGAGWSTVAAASGGTGLSIMIELCGVLARSLAG
jgi:hypothetical protein